MAVNKKKKKKNSVNIKENVEPSVEEKKELTEEPSKKKVKKENSIQKESSKEDALKEETAKNTSSEKTSECPLNNMIAEIKNKEICSSNEKTLTEEPDVDRMESSWQEENPHPENVLKDNLPLKKKNTEDQCVKETPDSLNREGVENKHSLKIAFIILLLMLILIGGLFFPRVKLSGASKMEINYKENYVEPGYKAYIFNKDVSNQVKVVNHINPNLVGEYQIEYIIKLGGIPFKKVRTVFVVDKEKPKIDMDSEVIEVCPYQDVPVFSYRAIDNYDGDITSKVEKIIAENEVLLRVMDSSNNLEEVTVKIDRVDREAPTISLKGGNTIYLDYGSTYHEPGYTVLDNCSKNLEDKVVVKGKVGREIGVYKLNYEVEDESKNKGIAERTVIVRAKIYDNGEIKNGSIYLTFDDGPSSATTEKILDILKEEGVKATFFVTCNGPDALIKRMYEEGHTVALHTASHDYSYVYSSTDNYFADLNRVKNRVKNITGYDSTIIRFPGGSSNTVSRNYKIGIMTELSNLVLSKGYHYFDWNVDAMDASSARNSADVYYNVTSNLSMNRSNVVLMHDTKSITADALRNIIRFGKEQGYNFYKIDRNTYMVRHGINN